VLLRAAFPRFLARGDRAFFGAVLNSQIKEKGTAIVTMRSLDPARLEVAGESKKTVSVGPQGTAEVRFEVRARAVGRARVQMSVKLLGEADALEETLPVSEVVRVGDVLLYVVHRLDLDLDPKTAGFAAVIYGHSHQPSSERRDGILFLNPGSAGPRRFRLPVAIAKIRVVGTNLSPEFIHLHV